MILITGAAGFIGSCMLGFLNQQGIEKIIISDDFTSATKQKNWREKGFQKKINRNSLFEYLGGNDVSIDAVLHLGARTDTTEFDTEIFDRLNLNYSQKLWKYCVKKNIPFIYASSAATYGSGNLGFDDSHDIIKHLKPLNPYGKSKNDFDLWVLRQKEKPANWYGFKFFNVYGPNEYHKGRMASVIFHTYNQIQGSGKMKLFKSHKKEFQNGEQSRDFIYVKDLVKTLYYFLVHTPQNGIYNLGTGNARSFLDLATSVFHALELKPNIEFIDTPKDIRNNYQYFTQAKIDKLQQQIKNVSSFHTLENGINDYVKNYLTSDRIY